MGVDTHFYLFDYRKYSQDAVPALDSFLHQGESASVRPMFEEARRTLDVAEKRWPPLWGPLNVSYEQAVREASLLIDGEVPKNYHGDRHIQGTITEPALARE